MGFLCIVESLIYLPSFPLISQLSDRLTINRQHAILEVSRELKTDIYPESVV